MEAIFASKVGDIITVSKAKLLRSNGKPISGVKYCVGISISHSRDSFIYCNNIAMGVYWYLFDLLILSHTCHISTPKQRIFELLKECRLYI